ncbi:MAG: hypothetical protein IT236_01220 [Bacteroidia bacterium]|nr:hypothetical protein [Bacteroidia bacterium]
METKEGLNITILVAIAAMGILLIVFIVVLLVVIYQKRMLASQKKVTDLEKKHQKRLLDASLEIAEAERQKIANNLHDDIGIIFNVLKLNLSRLKKNIHKPETVDKIIAESNTSIDNSLDIVRAIYSDIVPPTLKMAGLIKGVNEMCKQLSTSAGIEIGFATNREYIDFDKTVELQLYRLIREIINNTIKHAKPVKMAIDIRLVENTVTFTLEHDGTGITTAKIKELAVVSQGLGLKSILTRSELINASLEFTIPSSSQALVVLRMLLPANE